MRKGTLLVPFLILNIFENKTMAKKPKNIISAENIVKTFPGVLAVDEADFSCRPAEIHGLVGENGAGKSTLMRILAGIYSPDEGEIYFKGELTDIQDYHEAIELGIDLVHQETSLFGELTVCENLFLERPISQRGTLNWGDMEGKAEEILERVGLETGVWKKVKTLGVAKCQKLEIAKALLKDPEVLLLDEPTAPLPRPDVESLFTLLRELREEGMAIIFISHQVDEVLEVASRITVMKDGATVETLMGDEVNRDQVIQRMVGRELGDIFPSREPITAKEGTGKTALKITDLLMPDWGTKVSMEVKEGEILGIGGLQGQGQEQLVRSLFGLVPRSSGSIESGPLNSFPKHPKQAQEGGLALIPSDRHRQGLLLIRSVLENLSLPTLDQRQNWGFIDQFEERNVVTDTAESLDIKASSLEQRVLYLSGGNQQKVVIGKWFMSLPRVLLMIEPTRGVDVATKQEIYTLLHNLAEDGISVIFTTTDMLELIGLCDRVKVMYSGRFTSELSGSRLTEENIIEAAIPEQHQFSNHE